MNTIQNDFDNLQKQVAALLSQFEIAHGNNVILGAYLECEQIVDKDNEPIVYQFDGESFDCDQKIKIIVVPQGV